VNDWQQTIVSVYQVLHVMISIIKSLGKIRKIVPKEYTVTEIRDALQSSELHFGDKINVLGTFSEYLPFVDPKFILKGSEPFPRTSPRTVRIEAIDDIYCGALFPLDQKDAFAKETIPTFYGIDSKMLEYSTGHMLEMKCRITEVPIQYKKLINHSEFFTFEKEENLTIPFGLQILKVEPYGLVDSFKVNTWLLGNLNPAPRFEPKHKRKTCIQCANLFYYMGIDPLGWPPRFGCLSPTLDQSNASSKIKQSSKRFLSMEKKGLPYVAFPKPFELFEVFCPNIDIFDVQQIEHSNDLLIGSVKLNMNSLFQIVGVFPPDLKIPKGIECKVDFQYDQRKKLTAQNFDPKKIPIWTCPHYKPKLARK